MTGNIRHLMIGAAFISLAAGMSAPARAAVRDTDPAENPDTRDVSVPRPGTEPDQTSGEQDQAPQASDQNSTAQQQDDTVNYGGDIIVTAQKRAQRLQDVPISVGVVTGETIDEFSASDFKAIQNLVPNVYVQQTNGNDTIYIRGFGSPPQNFSFDQSVSVYVDGVYTGRVRQALHPFFDVERVEVLRGPQGALYGKNTPAGAVSVVTAGPTDTFEGAIRGLYNFDLEGYDITGHVSGPITDNFGLRVAARIRDQRGFIKNVANGNDEPRNKLQLFRISGEWEPSDAVHVSGKLELSHQRRLGGISVASPLDTEQQPKLTRYTTDSALGKEGTENRSVLGSVTADFDIGTHTLTAVTGYSWFNGNVVNAFDQFTPDDQATTPNTVYNSYPENFHQFSEEVRLQSPTGGTLEYLIGAYYDDSRYNLTQLGGFNIPALDYFGLLETDFHQEARTISGFAQVTVRPVDALSVIGSLRYTNTHKTGHFDGRLRYGPFALRPVDTVADGKISEGLWDPSIKLQYDITNNIMVYATYGQGSKSGGFVSNTYGTTDDTFIYEPERSRNYEVGVKSTLFQGKVTANLSLYDTRIKDLQRSVYNPVLQSYLVGNAASATSKGIEGTLRIAPSRYFDISASAAYQDITYDDYPGASCLATQPLSECDPASPSSIENNNLAGYNPAYTSDFTGNVSAHWRLDLGDYKFDTTGIVGGRSGYYDSDDQSPFYGYQHGYAKVDLRIQFAPQDDRWHVALVGKNLTDELTTSSAFSLPAPITPIPRGEIFLEPGRNIAVEAGVKF